MNKPVANSDDGNARQATGRQTPAPPSSADGSANSVNSASKNQSASIVQNVWVWLKWPFALGLIGWLVYANRDQFQKILEQEIDWPLLILAFGCSLTALLMQFYRWMTLVRAQQFEFGYRDATRLGFLGLMFNYVAPGAVGGDVVKAGLMIKEQESRRAIAVATILLDRILGFIAMFVVGTAGTLMVSVDFPHREKIEWVLWGGTSAGVIGLLVLLHPSTPNSRWLGWFTRIPKVGPIIQDIAVGIALYQTKRRVILNAVGIGVLSHLLIVASFYSCGQSVGAASDVPSYKTQMLLLPPAQVISVFVPLPGGMGALEGTVHQAYKLVGSPGGLGILAAGAYRVTQIVVALIGAVIYASIRKTLKPLPETDAHTSG